MTTSRYPRGYGCIQPVATYMPWDADDAFRALYAKVSAHTLVDAMRGYELVRLVEQVAPLTGDVIEVGVWRGGTAALLGEAMQRYCQPDTCHLWLADTFSGVVKAGSRDPYYTGGEHSDTSPHIVDSLLRDIGIARYTVLEGVFPEQSSALADSASFRLCHIDVDVYQSAKDALTWVWPRLVIHGIVVFDDYGFYGCEGVTALVDEERAQSDRLFIHNVNGHGILIKRR